MLFFRSLVLGLLGALVLIEISQLHTHLHQREDTPPAIVVVPQERSSTRTTPQRTVARPTPVFKPIRPRSRAVRSAAMDDTVIVDIQRTTIDHHLDGGRLSSSARFVPYLHRGTPRGYKLYAIRANSLFAVLGLKSGDVLSMINNRPVVAEASEWTPVRWEKPAFLDLSIERAGRPMRIVVLIHEG